MSETTGILTQPETQFVDRILPTEGFTLNILQRIKIQMITLERAFTAFQKEYHQKLLKRILLCFLKNKPTLRLIKIMLLFIF